MAGRKLVRPACSTSAGLRHVVFMGMGQKNRIQSICLFEDELQVRHNDFNAGCRVHVSETNPQINHDPAPFVLRTVAVEIAIHPNLTRATQRKVDQFTSSFRHAVPID